MSSVTQLGERVVAAGVATGLGSVTLVKERYVAPIDVVGVGAAHHLQLSMIPCPKQPVACYVDRWSPGRFEALGDVFLLPAGASLRTQSECREQQSVVCDFLPERVDEWFGEGVDWTDERLTGSLDIASADTRRWLFRIARELHSPGFASDTMIELISGQICVELARWFRRIELGVAAAGGLPAWRRRLIDDYLACDPGSASLAVLAGLCGISVRQLARGFRASTGRSLGDYIAEHRIARACQMLGEGQSVKQTAYAVGFSAASNFAAAFRRAMGSSPRQYRQQQAKPLR